MSQEKKKKTEDKNEEVFINPIDKDKIAENPGLLPYAHSIGGVQIRPEDKGRLKGQSVTAMHQQTDRQMKQLYDQMETLARQAKALKKRKEVSEQIYCADMNFQPVIGKEYYLYERADQSFVLSMVAHDEWGRKFPFKKYIAQVELMADHTWRILDENLEEKEEA